MAPVTINLRLAPLPTPELRREREISRYRLHLVKHRTTLKNECTRR